VCTHRCSQGHTGRAVAVTAVHRAEPAALMGKLLAEPRSLMGRRTARAWDTSSTRSSVSRRAHACCDALRVQEVGGKLEGGVRSSGVARFMLVFLDVTSQLLLIGSRHREWVTEVRSCSILGPALFGCAASMAATPRSWAHRSSPECVLRSIRSIRPVVRSGGRCTPSNLLGQTQRPGHHQGSLLQGDPAQRLRGRRRVQPGARVQCVTL
jgi:hypothetical protein